MPVSLEKKPQSCSQVDVGTSKEVASQSSYLADKLLAEIAKAECAVHKLQNVAQIRLSDAALLEVTVLLKECEQNLLKMASISKEVF